jgi:hypothetical protein
MESTAAENVETLDIPKVLFVDEKLQVAVGQCIRILPSQTVTGTNSFKIFTPLDSSELIKRTKITEDMLT